MPGDDRILPETRRAAGVIVVALLVAAVLLYFLPDRTEAYWAWTIRPTLTPMLMGAGYFAGATFFARLAGGERWHRFHVGFLPITIFVTVMAKSTVLHWDRFDRAQPAFYAWTFLYAVTPVLIPYLWWRNRAADPGAPEPGDVVVPAGMRRLFGLAGAALVLVGAWLFLLPEAAIAAWPWALTPFTSRVVSGWVALHGALGLVLASEPRWSAARIGLQTQLVFFALFLVALARAWPELDPAKPGTWAFLLVTVGLALTLGLIYLDRERRRPARQA